LLDLIAAGRGEADVSLTARVSIVVFIPLLTFPGAFDHAQQTNHPLSHSHIGSLSTDDHGGGNARKGCIRMMTSTAQ
jgi:hypothetical protein